MVCAIRVKLSGLSRGVKFATTYIGEVLANPSGFLNGGGLSRGALYNYMVMSGIEAIPTTRLYEIWFKQKWGTHLALRAGQLAADYEFMTAKYTGVFTNASLGWNAGLALNLPSGGALIAAGHHGCSSPRGHLAKSHSAGSSL